MRVCRAVENMSGHNSEESFRPADPLLTRCITLLTQCITLAHPVHHPYSPGAAPNSPGAHPLLTRCITLLLGGSFFQCGWATH